MPQYKNKYYDPVKAHEYYEAHKKLKGRKSTAELNEKGKAASKYVKDKLNKKKKADIEKHKAQIKKQIDAIRKKYKKLSPKERKKRKKEIQKAIQKLRDINKKNTAAIRKAYDNLYVSELQKMKADSSMTKAGDKAKQQAESEKHTKEIQAKIDTHNAEMVSKIEQIRKEFNDLSSANKKKLRKEYKRRLDKLKEEHKQAIEAILNPDQQRYNDHHDAKTGQFASKAGSGSGSVGISDLSDQEVESISNYTKQGYRQIRNPNTTDPKAIKDRETIESIIAKSPKYDGMIYRGIALDAKSGEDFVKKLVVGAKVDMKGISSWSADKNVATRFSGRGGKPCRIRFECRNKSGVSIKDVSSSNYEEEVICSGKTRYIVKNVNRAKGSSVISVELEEE